MAEGMHPVGAAYAYEWHSLALSLHTLSAACAGQAASSAAPAPSAALRQGWTSAAPSSSAADPLSDLQGPRTLHGDARCRAGTTDEGSAGHLIAYTDGLQACPVQAHEMQSWRARPLESALLLLLLLLPDVCGSSSELASFLRRLRGCSSPARRPPRCWHICRRLLLLPQQARVLLRGGCIQVPSHARGCDRVCGCVKAASAPTHQKVQH